MWSICSADVKFLFLLEKYHESGIGYLPPPQTILHYQHVVTGFV